jgi:hypothetical protein
VVDGVGDDLGGEQFHLGELLLREGDVPAADQGGDRVPGLRHGALLGLDAKSVEEDRRP